MICKYFSHSFGRACIGLVLNASQSSWIFDNLKMAYCNKFFVHFIHDDINNVIIWQSQSWANPSTLIGSFSVRLLHGNGPSRVLLFWSKACKFTIIWNNFIWNQDCEKLRILLFFRGTQRQLSENICSEDDWRSRIFGTFVVKFLACLPFLGFSII